MLLLPQRNIEIVCLAIDHFKQVIAKYELLYDYEQDSPERLENQTIK